MKIIQAHSEVAAKVVAKIVIDKYEKNNIDIYIAVFGIWFVIYGISICSQYVALKYEIETIDNVVVINRVYEIVNMSTIINLVWFVLSAILFVIFVVQYKQRNKKQTDERIIKSHGE